MHDSTRKWFFFSQDDKIGVADTSQLYIWQKSGPAQLYDIASGQELPLSQKADSMKTYAFSMIQYAQLLRERH